MTSQLNVDTIVDKAGSGGTNVKVGNTSTYVSDGGSATQNLVQGLQKHFIHFSGASTDGSANLTGVDDSFNTSSVVDKTTGTTTVAFTNNMNSVSYIHTASVTSSGGSFNAWVTGDGTAHTTSQYVMKSYHVSSGAVDLSDNQSQVSGDLA